MSVPGYIVLSLQALNTRIQAQAAALASRVEELEAQIARNRPEFVAPMAKSVEDIHSTLTAAEHTFEVYGRVMEHGGVGGCSKDHR